MRDKDKIEQILKKKFDVTRLEVMDDSELHAGHSGAAQGGGTHFTVIIVSNDFLGKSRVERHRMVYNALKEEIKEGLHALVIKALSPSER